jgi:predicted transcriptional regulator
MIIPCEVAVKSVIPALRALVAKELTQKHNLKQNDAASLLGITQAAVSKYNRNVRGRVIEIEKIDDIQQIVLEIVELLTSNSVSRNAVVHRFCLACQIVREKRLMCHLCEKNDQSINCKECFVCSSANCFKS